MLHYDRFVWSKRTDVAEHNSSKKCYYCCFLYLQFSLALSATTVVLIMGSSFKIPFVVFVTIWQCCVLIPAVLPLLLLKISITTVLFITLANLMQLIYQKIHCLMRVDISKMHFKDINIKNKVYSNFLDYLI